MERLVRSLSQSKQLDRVRHLSTNDDYNEARPVYPLPRSCSQPKISLSRMNTIQQIELEALEQSQEVLKEVTTMIGSK